jgi:transposase
MARYKDTDSGMKLLAVDLTRQLLPGTFEHALSHLIDQELDLSHFDAHYRNDVSGSKAYPPTMLLKVVLFAYSQGIVSSRAIERACRDHVTFMALSGDRVPHFTTIASFVSGREQDIKKVFAAVLSICLRQGLIGQEMFAIDGVKLPSNASKAKSGTRAEFQKQLVKLETAASIMLQRHREHDDQGIEPGLETKAQQRATDLRREAQNLKNWLATYPDRKGARGAIRKSNRTDNESAKMATSKGVIQGYTGVAAVDAKHQIIVEAQAHGTGSEQELLLPVVEALNDSLTPATVLTVDAGYHSEKNLQALEDKHIDALIADNDMRKRDERFATQRSGSAARQIASARCGHALHCKRLPARSATPNVCLSGGQDSATQWHASRQEGLCRGSVQRSRHNLPSLPAAHAVSAPSRQTGRSASDVL